MAEQGYDPNRSRVSDDRMADMGDNHEDPNIDASYLLVKGHAVRVRALR